MQGGREALPKGCTAAATLLPYHAWTLFSEQALFIEKKMQPDDLGLIAAWLKVSRCPNSQVQCEQVHPLYGMGNGVAFIVFPPYEALWVFVWQTRWLSTPLAPQLTGIVSRNKKGNQCAHLLTVYKSSWQTVCSCRQMKRPPWLKTQFLLCAQICLL